MATTERGKVLVVDDEPNAVRVLSMILQEEGYRVFDSLGVDSAIGVMQKEDVDAVITDIKMPVKDGFQLFRYVSEHHNNIPVMFLTAHGTVDSAVTALTNGAYYYFLKPPDYTQLKTVLAKAIGKHSSERQFESLKQQRSRENNPHSIVGISPAIAGIRRTIETVKDSDSSVLILGDTGTGKEVIARSLHFQSKRFNKPFVAVNCAAIPHELMESEFFGHEKGAYTGAVSARMGKFEEAMNGTIFLDEIGELELSMQAKLLRVLQEREVMRIGANRPFKVNFRLVSSTNRDLVREVEQGRFREDLFYRVNIVQITVPPLRERREDIPLLSRALLNEFSLRENRLFTLTDDVMDILFHYSWPGNVRQLRNVIERAVVLARGDRISRDDLPGELVGSQARVTSFPAVKPLRELEREAVAEALHACHGNISKAARTLGISRKTFYKRLHVI